MKSGLASLSGQFTGKFLSALATHSVLLVATATLAFAADPYPGDSCSSAKAHSGNPYFGGSWSTSDIQPYSGTGGCPGSPQTYSCESGQSRTINWQLKCGCEYDQTTGKYTCYWQMDYCRVTIMTASCFRKGLSCPGDSCGSQSGTRLEQDRKQENYNTCLAFELANIFPPRRGSNPTIVEAQKRLSKRASARQLRTREKLRNRVATAARITDFGEPVHSELPKECMKEE